MRRDGPLGLSLGLLHRLLSAGTVPEGPTPGIPIGLGPLTLTYAGVQPFLVTGLWGFWPFDGDTNDYSVNGRDLPEDELRRFTGGVVGQALAHRASYYEPSPRPISDKYTLSCWFLAGPIARNASSSPLSLLTCEAGSMLMGLEIYPRSATGVDIQPILPSAVPTPTDYPITSAGQWVHVAVVYDGAAATASMYLDGALAETYTLLDTPAGQELTGILFGTFLGVNPICHVGIWTRALSGSEISVLYDAIRPGRSLEPLTNNIHASFEFDTGFTESTGNVSSFTTSGGFSAVPSVVGRAVAHDASVGFWNGTADVPALSGRSIAGSTWAISGWLKSDLNFGKARLRIQGTEPGEPAAGLNVTLESNTLTILVGEVGSGSSPIRMNVTRTVSDGWHHIVVTGKGTGQIDAYLDGILLATEPSIDTNDNTFESNLRLTCDYFFWTAGSGAIDLLKFWPRYLSASDVTALYKYATYSYNAEPFAILRHTVISSQTFTDNHTSAAIDLGVGQRPPFIQLRMTYARINVGTSGTVDWETSYDGVTWSTMNPYFGSVATSWDESVWIPDGAVRRYIRCSTSLSGGSPSATWSAEVRW